MAENRASADDGLRFRKRAYPRCELRLSTKMELEDGREVAFRTSNISQNGFSGHTIEAAPIGSGVELHLPKIGPVAGEVVWQVGTAFGARLNDILSVHDIMALALDTMKSAQDDDPEAPQQAEG